MWQRFYSIFILVRRYSKALLIDTNFKFIPQKVNPALAAVIFNCAMKTLIRSTHPILFVIRNDNNQLGRKTPMEPLRYQEVHRPTALRMVFCFIANVSRVLNAYC
jgi:hypothetical protein